MAKKTDVLAAIRHSYGCKHDGVDRAVTLSLSAGSWRTILQLFAAAPTVEQCAGIPADTEGLKCFDQAALSLRTSPAKGGIAPPLFEPITGATSKATTAN
ncbi:MAG TPA: hypothetical protein VGD13_08685 [Xanthobacteraceae bacterium]